MGRWGGGVGCVGPVDDDDDGGQNAEGDGGKNEEPAGSGAPASDVLQGDGHGSVGADGDVLLAELGGHGVGELLARAAEAVGVVAGDLVGQAEEGKEGNDLRGDDDQKSDDEEGAESGDADEEEDLVAEGIKEVQGVGNKEKTRDEQGDEHERLLDLELLVHVGRAELSIGVLGGANNLGVGGLGLNGLAVHVEIGLRVVVEGRRQGGVGGGDASVRVLDLELVPIDGHSRD